MGSASPPKRMTRSRAAAASATATSLGAQTTKSDRVTKATKSTTSTKAKAKATTASAKKPAATKKSVAAKKPVTTTKKPAAKTAAKATTTTTATTTPATTTATSSTATATKKRKLRAFDNDDEDDLSKEDNTHTMNHPAKKPRGRAKKAVDPESDSESESESHPKLQEKDAQSTNTTITRPTRGRPKKSTATTAASSAPKKQTQSTTTLTRTRKTTNRDGDVAAAAEKPAKKTTRGRAATGTVTTTYATEPTPGLKSAVSRPASKVTGILKKTVSFEEPEKENMLPGAATKAKIETTGTTATGMKARPVRKPTTTSGRTTRASARAATTNVAEKRPLSPKKDGQNRPLSRDASSDDELATYEKTPLKSLMKSPVKPPTGVKKLELPPSDEKKDENSPQSLEPTFASVFNSPARRPPPSSFKDSMKSPAKRVDAIPSLIFPSTSAEEKGTQSPSKVSMLQSPAKRPHMPLQAFQFNQEQVGTPRSPMKMSLLSTPAKRPASPMKLLGSPVSRTENKPHETSKDDKPTMEEISEEQLQSQIRAETGSISPQESAVAQKGLEPIEEVDDEYSIRLESPTPQLPFPGRLSAVLPRHADPALKQNHLPAPEPTTQSARLNSSEPQSEPQSTDTSEATAVESAVPNSAEVTTPTIQFPQLNSPEPQNSETKTCEAQSEQQSMDTDDITAIESVVPNSAQTTPPQAAPKRAGFGLRAKDLEDEVMSDSEDELAFSNKAATKHQDHTLTRDPVPATPAPPIFKGTKRTITPSVALAASKAIRSVSKGSGLGYTPLSVQLGAWRASSPLKARQSEQKLSPQAEDDEDEFSLLDENDFPVVETPAAKGFFDDEMRIRADMENEAAMVALLEADIAAKFDKHDFHDLGIMSDDLSIVVEADESSLINTEESEPSRPHDESISAASQEYGDENAVPIDPALFGNGEDAHTSNNIPVTPKRPFVSREFHTVSKVPLKRADDSPPRAVKRHCSTVSKPTFQRPSGPLSNVTLPSKRSFHMELEKQTDQESKFAPLTPSKFTGWSSVGTPARTTRSDLDPALLRGAIVFVDVHTTEGADAGRIFVDLLVQMGARCVKSWPWNPTSPTDSEVDVSKIGITHVVFKDGGKRTLEKVNESSGIVQCVGVSWVLDCEKENRWLNEKDYRVDTTLIPRGGHNRRKSMEPKAVANMNGTLVTPMKVNSGFSREPQTLPNNYMSRRDSTIWMRSPSENDEDEDAPSEPSEMDWESTSAPILTPVPKTPAPEMVAKFAMDITPGTPTASFDMSSNNNQLFMQTCPPKPSGLVNLGEGLVNRDQDQSVMMRLMAARRKSMQFAPKVESPLKRQLKQMD
ncbi:hypothetical protein E0Z10_g474 [Xylaria hypoxylon]|uniref:BRCT domain-containing protein n=1 Tax=Xylaria hypoxylon TaxID=37992 RepID=A0A4Z0Z9F4_9PEZI|nr:hypothetical protein E0Z10_g474 [Xylaria hypoxylon]